ncbi:MAG: PotD/PotF family extracellular solute-binding protein [Porticoccaceae bacterium]
MRRYKAEFTGRVFAILLCAVMGARASAMAAATVDFLCWAGVDDPALLEAFEKDTGIKVQCKTFVGGDSMYSLLTNSSHQYDVVMVGSEYVGKLCADGRLATLDQADYDLSQYIPTFKKLPLCYAKDKMIAIPIEFGANGLAYNTSVISADEASSYAILMSDKTKGKVGVWDRYLPIMGVLSKSLGNAAPYDISSEKFMALKKALLALHGQVSVIAPNFPVLIASLARGETVVVPGGAAFFATALQKQGTPIDWIIPKEGGIMWVDSLVIPTDAPHPDSAKSFLQWMCSPKAQALLANKKAFSASVPNAAAYPTIDFNVRKLLKTENGEEAEALAKKLAVRTFPVQQTEQIWQNAWGEFKAGQ